MHFVWDENKRLQNIQKHGIDFYDAETVLDSDVVISFPDERFTDDRWIAFGYLDTVVVHIAFQQSNEQTIRIISMRKATANERHLFAIELTRTAVVDPEFVEVLERIREEREFHDDMEKIRTQRGRRGHDKSEEDST